jgi:hypothetical protein
LKALAFISTDQYFIGRVQAQVARSDPEMEKEYTEKDYRYTAQKDKAVE